MQSCSATISNSMSMTNVMPKIRAKYKYTFVNETYNLLMKNLKKGMKLSFFEYQKMKKSKVLKFVALIPFEAGCSNPERVSIAHMLCYIYYKRNKNFFNANLSDNQDILKRLEMGMNFKDGNTDVIDKAMNVLALLMIEDYNTDKVNDYQIGKYNPLITNDINYDIVKKQLNQKILNGPDTPILDTIIDIFKDDDVGGFW